MTHIAILDFGSQYTHLIARRVRDLKALAKIYSNDIKASSLPNDVIGIIISGGPQSVYSGNSAGVDAGIFKLGNQQENSSLDESWRFGQPSAARIYHNRLNRGLSNRGHGGWKK